MTHLGFQIINLTSNSRTNLGEEDRAKRRKQRKVAVFQNRFPISLLTSTVGLDLRSSPDGREEADTWRALVWSDNEAADHWEGRHFGFLYGLDIFPGDSRWASVLFFRKAYPMRDTEELPSLPSPFAVEAEPWLPRENEFYSFKSPFQLEDPEDRLGPHPLSHALSTLHQLNGLRWAQTQSSILCLAPSQIKHSFLAH